MPSQQLALPALACLACLLLGDFAVASSGGSYSITKETIDGGGNSANGGIYRVTGTIGQPDAAVQAGSRYQLTGGFHGNGPAPNDTIFKNGFD